MGWRMGVLYDGAGYVSLVANNVGNTPDLSPGKWALFAAAGATGATGPAGSCWSYRGNRGAGIAGSGGSRLGRWELPVPQGPAVANYTGNYVSTTNYGLNDAVSYEGRLIFRWWRGMWGIRRR